MACTVDRCKQSVDWFSVWDSQGCIYTGAITADRDLNVEIARRLQRAWACIQRYKMEIHDRPGVRLRLKVRLLKAEVGETLVYGCMT